jgi:hypothetical protein
MVQDEVLFYGHPNVRSLHTKTIEITMDKQLSLRGDCIIGVRANKACSDLSESLKARLRQCHSTIIIEIMVGDETFTVRGTGDEQLLLTNQHDIVIRRTHFACPRTASVGCDSASSDIPRTIISALQNSNSAGIFRITAE